MHSITLEQLRVVSQAGGVSHVTLKGQGGAFVVHISDRNGSDAVLTKARSTEPRRFGSPTAALNLLRDLGITTGTFDASDWNPAERNPESRPGDKRVQVLRHAHASAAYNAWLSDELQQAIDDPRPSIPHDDVMARMDVRIERHKEPGAKRS